MEFVNFLICFSLGFVISYCIVMLLYHKNQISYFLTTIKEDIANLYVSMDHLAKKAKQNVGSFDLKTIIHHGDIKDGRTITPRFVWKLLALV